jgi:hypothetical protein
MTSAESGEDHSFAQFFGLTSGLLIVADATISRMALLVRWRQAMPAWALRGDVPIGMDWYGMVRRHGFD